MIVLLDADDNEVVAYDDELTVPATIEWQGRLFELEDSDGREHLYREVVS